MIFRDYTRCSSGVALLVFLAAAAGTRFVAAYFSPAGALRQAALLELALGAVGAGAGRRMIGMPVSPFHIQAPQAIFILPA
jgi:hypothetical protein